MSPEERFGHRVDRLTRQMAAKGELVAWLLNHPELPQYGGTSTIDRATAVRQCGQHLEFVGYPDHPEFPILLRASNFCRQHKLCPICSAVRGSQLATAYVPKVAQSVDQKGRIPMLLTFTMANQEHLDYQIRAMESALRSLLKDGSEWRRGRLKRWTEFARLTGAVFSYEIKRGEGTRGGGWHAHVHGLCLFDEMPDVDQLKAEWCEMLPLESVIEAQDARLLHSVALHGSPITPDVLLSDGLRKDVLEVFKYAVKISSMTPRDAFIVARLTHGRRLLRSYGDLYGLKPQAEYVDQLPDVTGCRPDPFALQWSGSRYDFC